MPPEFDNPELDPQLKKYHKELAALVTAVLAGSMARSVFQRRMRQLVDSQLTAAFLLAGGNPQNRAAQRRLAEEQRIHTRSINLLANDLFNGRYSANDDELPGLPLQTADEGKAKLDNRLGIWTVSLAGVYAMGQIYSAIQNRLLEWRLGPTEDTCGTCQGASDKGILRAYQWQELGIHPQGRMLDCGGWNCLCSLVEV